MGGKGVENTGGNIVDFLAASGLTGNAVLIEIKTPMTPLLGGQYRGDIFNVSTDLSGAALQISNYKQSLLLEYNQIRGNSAEPFEAFDPRCLVIIGRLSELDSATKSKTFELFRNGLSRIDVITFDELLHKIATLIALLEGEV